jgi:threonine/homoserine/homoserine lactone efflux protein
MLISHSSLLLFVTGAAILLVIPGPAVTYIVSRSIGHGRTAGLVSVLGITTGTVCHIIAATLGLTAVLASSALAFQSIKYVGAAYLIYLGIKTLLQKDERFVEAARGETSSLRLYGQGLLVCLLNPKTALFFLAFLPQFVDPVRGHVTLQILQLGILFAAASPRPAQHLRRRAYRAGTGVGVVRIAIKLDWAASANGSLPPTCLLRARVIQQI